MGGQYVSDEYVSNAGAVKVFAAGGLHVAPKTVSRWGKEGKLPFIRTLGGHRRYKVADLEAKLATLRFKVAEEREGAAS